MVQRKVPHKLALQSDHHVKTQNHTKGTSDLKIKKMKKSGSIKRPELDTRSSNKPPPNYMKSTTSSDARTQVQVCTNTSSSLRKISSNVAEVGSWCGSKSTKTTTSLKMMRTPSFKPARGQKCLPVAFYENLDAQKATCSSTLKDSKFPQYLNLNPEGTSVAKVCSYTYCSLNGHHHRAPLPPLKCFMLATKRAIKNIKSGLLSPRNVKPTSLVLEQEKDDIFVEIYCQTNEVKIEESREEQCLETLIDAPMDDHDEEHNQEIKADEEPLESMSNSEASEYLPEREIEFDLEKGKDDSIINSDDEVPADELSQESFDEESLDSDALSNFSDNEHTEALDDLESLKDTNTHEVEPLDETITSSDKGQHVQTELHHENEDNSTEDILQATKAAKKIIQEVDESALFNPRGPNFLEVEADPEGEKVDLKHQDLDERKNAEEWMVDYALRKVVTNLGTARKRKVALLVEAFEKVMPVTKCDIHLRHHGSGFDQARTIQACR